MINFCVLRAVLVAGTQLYIKQRSFQPSENVASNTAFQIVVCIWIVPNCRFRFSRSGLGPFTLHFHKLLNTMLSLLGLGAHFEEQGRRSCKAIE